MSAKPLKTNALDEKASLGTNKAYYGSSGEGLINPKGEYIMKMNQNPLIAVVITSWLALPLAAQQTPGNANSPNERDPARSALSSKTAFNEIEKADKIIGMDVTDMQDHNLGRVKDLAVDLQAGRIAEVIVGTGGLAGMEEKMIAVPPASFSFASSGQKLRLADAETFKIAPFFKMSHWKEATSSANVAEVYQRFHAAPYGNVAGLQRADKIIGLTAKNRQRQHLGRVETMVVDLSAGRVAEVILASGGFMGIKDQWSAVPPQAFRYDPDKKALTLDTTRDALKNAPHFKPADWRDSVNNTASLSGVSNASTVPPYATPGSTDTTVQNAAPQGAMTPANTVDLQSDPAITARIQQLIMATDGLSVNARSAQVSTQSGRVTLRGTADSDREKKQLGDIAASVVTADHVDNQIEVRDIGASAGLSGN